MQVHPPPCACSATIAEFEVQGSVPKRGRAFILLSLLGAERIDCTRKVVSHTWAFPSCSTCRISVGIARFSEVTAMRPIDAAIVETLQRTGPCSLDDVVTSLSSYSWGEVFSAVDRMSRDKRVSVSLLGDSTYQLSLVPQAK